MFPYIFPPAISKSFITLIGNFTPPVGGQQTSKIVQIEIDHSSLLSLKEPGVRREGVNRGQGNLYVDNSQGDLWTIRHCIFF